MKAGDRVEYTTPGRYRTGHRGTIRYVNTEGCFSVDWDDGGFICSRGISPPSLKVIDDSVDWDGALELNDGTPVTYRGHEGHFVDLRLSSSHPCQPSGRLDITARADDGLVISNHKYKVRNVMPKIDITKPLEVETNTGVVSDVPFITMTSEGHILVGRRVMTPSDNAAFMSTWHIFDVNGDWVRSDPIGNILGGWVLRNKIEKKTRYCVIGASWAWHDDADRMWRNYPDIKQAVRVDFENDVAVSSIILSRP